MNDKQCGLFLALMLVPALMAGCISGNGDLDSDDWNSAVQDINAILTEGYGYNEDVNYGIQDKDYERALSSIDDAIMAYTDAMDGVDTLSGKVGGENYGFLSDYLKAWKGQIQQTVSGLSYLRIVINIDIFNAEFYKIASIHPTAELQMAQSFSYYVAGEYGACSTSAENSTNKYSFIADVSEALIPVSVQIGESYVLDYVEGMGGFCTHAMGALGDLMSAAAFASNGDTTMAGQLYISANEKYALYVSAIEHLIDIESLHPNAFPSQGYALGSLQGTYILMIEGCEEQAQDYRERMDLIELEHEEFFSGTQ